MRNFVLSSSLFVLSVSYDALAAVVSQDLHIVNTILSPDGLARRTVTADGVFPAPLISGNIGDNFRINVIDELTDPTMRRAVSIHWHGFFQAGTTEMDGPAFVSQCPIIPDESFLYDFNVPDQAGTFWYHAHLSTQYCDGLRGPFVVYDPDDAQKDLYDVDDASTVITIADWYHDLSTALFPNPTKAAPSQDSTLVNGLGRFNRGPLSPLAVIRAQPGLRHRFRLVNAGCNPSHTVSFDNHRMTVIEVDGVAHEPVTVDSLTIFAGQRYSVIVNADQAVDNYWIRVNPSGGTRGFDNGINSAILRYDGAPDAEPTTLQTMGVLLNEANLRPLVNPGAPGNPVPGGADVNINLAIARDAITRDFTINGAPYLSPTVPVLLQILSGSSAPTDLLPAGSVISLPANKVIEVSIPGGGGHPFHLHGHTFDVIRVGGSRTYNFDNPVRRDVVSTGAGGDNVTFRFVTDNPGPWFLHCHIEWHLEAGLAVVFAEDVPNIPVVNDPNADWDALCPSYDANNPDSGLA